MNTYSESISGRSAKSGRHVSGGRAAFTLVELLVVIAILGLLASLLMPAVGRTGERGRAVSCLNKQRQIGAAVLMYANDHGGRMPTELSRASGPWRFPDLTWMAQIWPYLDGGDWAVFSRFFHCPSDTHPYVRPPSDNSEFPGADGGAPGSFSYGYNLTVGSPYREAFGLGGWAPGDPRLRPKRIYQIPGDGMLLAHGRRMTWITLSLNSGYPAVGAVRFVHGRPGQSTLGETFADMMNAPVNVPQGGGGFTHVLHADGSVRAYSIAEIQALHTQDSRWRLR